MKLELYLVTWVLKLEIQRPSRNRKLEHTISGIHGGGVFQKYHYTSCLFVLIFVNCYQLCTWSPIWWHIYMADILETRYLSSSYLFWYLWNDTNCACVAQFGDIYIAADILETRYLSSSLIGSTSPWSHWSAPNEA